MKSWKHEHKKGTKEGALLICLFMSSCFHVFLSKFRSFSCSLRNSISRWFFLDKDGIGNGIACCNCVPKWSLGTRACVHNKLKCCNHRGQLQYPGKRCSRILLPHPFFPASHSINSANSVIPAKVESHQDQGQLDSDAGFFQSAVWSGVFSLHDDVYFYRTNQKNDILHDSKIVRKPGSPNVLCGFFGVEKWREWRFSEIIYWLKGLSDK